MNLKLPFLASLLLIQTLLFAQVETKIVDWNKYLPQSKVDKVIYYHTNGHNDKKLNESVYNRLLHRKEQSDSLTNVLPMYYENKPVVTDAAIITEIVKAMPMDSCASIPVSRCGGYSRYRDIVLFYNKNKLVFVLKVCMECESTVSIPAKYESNCLENNMFNVMNHILGIDLFGNFRW